MRAAAPVIYQEAMGLPKTDLVTLPADPIQLQPTYESALSAFEALPEIRVLFDNGAGTSPTGSTTAGDPYPGFEQSFSDFPIPGTTAKSWYLGPGGTLNEQPSTVKGVDSYTSDAKATPLTDYGANTGTGGLWGNASQWEYNWEQPPSGSAVSYVSAPLTSNTTAIGGGAVQLWVKSSTPNVDFQEEPPSRYCKICLIFWCRVRDLNPRPPDYKSGALPTVLTRLARPYSIVSSDWGIGCSCVPVFRRIAVVGDFVRFKGPVLRAFKGQVLRA